MLFCLPELLIDPKIDQLTVPLCILNGMCILSCCIMTYWIVASWHAFDTSLSFRCGFAGETGPRFIIPSEIRKPGQQQVGQHCFCHVEITYIVQIINVIHNLMIAGHQSSSVQYQHRRTLCNPQRVYPFTVLQVRLLYFFVWIQVNTGALFTPKKRKNIFLIQASAGESSRQKGGHHRVHPLPVSFQGDAHQGFLQTVWGNNTNPIFVFIESET